tara:strand:+ start:97 stop:303 length:207 start_codon:yes stop_codon:yes gene_type:complete
LCVNASFLLLDIPSYGGDVPAPSNISDVGKEVEAGPSNRADVGKEVEPEPDTNEELSTQVLVELFAQG